MLELLFVNYQYNRHIDQTYQTYDMINIFYHSILLFSSWFSTCRCSLVNIRKPYHFITAIQTPLAVQQRYRTCLYMYIYAQSLYPPFLPGDQIKYLAYVIKQLIPSFLINVCTLYVTSILSTYFIFILYHNHIYDFANFLILKCFRCFKYVFSFILCKPVK